MKVALIIIAVCYNLLGFSQSNWFPSTGNVGIGTTTPTTVLHLKTSLNSSIALHESTSSDNVWSAIKNSNAQLNLGIGSASTTNGFGYLWSSSGNFMIGNDGNPTLSVTGMGNGKVGIGTIVPNQKVEVVGNGTSVGLKVRHANEITDWGIIIHQRENLDGRIACEGQNFQIEAGWNKTLTLGHPEFSTYGGKVVFPGGNVGIGTTSPDAKLSVKGTIHAEEVKVDLSVPGPDYVFEKDYPLTSLEELKSYIDQNKHLPEIPSAKEMEEEGINLKEMNLLLLRKIEEMTLHLIQQSEQIAHLKEDSRVSADSSAKKVEELTLHLIQQEKINQQQNKKLDELREMIEKND